MENFGEFHSINLLKYLFPGILFEIQSLTLNMYLLNN